MILTFPDADTFRLVLTGGFVPADVVLAPAIAAIDPAGPVSLDFDAKLPKKVTADLTRLGVSLARRHVADAFPVSCWLQVVPVTRQAAPPQFASQAPVLFELESAADLPAIVGEMLRLGNDRQAVRWLAAGDGAADKRVLMRVIGPPYYTLLRAIDRATDCPSQAVRAYLEQAPRVWVEVGYEHPFAAQIKVADGQVLFLRPVRDWQFVPDAPFQDVYDILDFQLPARPTDWADVPTRDKLTIPLKLVAGNAADAPELWVLRGSAADQLDELVRDADERLTSRLKFAVAEDAAGGTVIVLRTIASKLAPPVLPLAGVVGYKPYHKLPNLYLPAGTRLHPTLRRDAVRNLLADDTDRLVWLAPIEGGGFVPETLPEDSFRPLEDWVDYVIEADAVPLSAWVDATRFEFEAFVCSDTNAAKLPKPPADKDDKGKKPRGPADDAPLAADSVAKGARKSAARDAPAGYATPPAAEAKPPGEWLLRRQELERDFLAVDGPLDAPERTVLWPELAVANTGYGDTQEAAVCWLNALWELPVPPAAERDGWLRSELPALADPTPADLDRLTGRAEPSAGEARQFAAAAFKLTHETPVPAGVRDLLPPLQRYLEANEPKLPVRAVWLLAAKFAELSGADTLGLARTRDRLLQRLLEEGLKPERDLPYFLRSAGLKDSDRIRHVRDKAVELHKAVRTWAEASLKQTVGTSQGDKNATLGYIDLFFGYSLAKLGEATAARVLAGDGRRELTKFDPAEDVGVVAHYLAKAFTSRVEGILAGPPAAGPLDPVLLEELDDIHKKAGANAKADNPYRIGHYGISRMRQQSRILEPQEKLDPYQEYGKENDNLRKAVTDLPRLRDPAALARTVRDLYRNGVGGKATADSRFLVLHNALLLAGRVGEPFTVELLHLVPDTLKGVGGGGGPPPAELLAKQGQLLERGLYLAAHFDRREIVQQFVDLFVELTQAKTDDQKFELVNVVVPQCLRSLRKMGLRDETDKLLRRLQDVILAGQAPGKLRERYAGKPEQWGKALQSLLTLAGGWLTFGLTAQATPILDLARAELFGPAAAKLAPSHFTPLAQAYVAALGQGPADEGLDRIVELFRQMDPAKVANAFTTSKFYSRFHLNLVEEVVLAVVSDDFALGSAGRRWLEEDEFIVRRRVHADMRRLLAAGGL